MRKIWLFLFSLKKFILFFKPPFWRSWQVLVLIFLSLSLNLILWYYYQVKIKQNPIPFLFASGVFVLNLILANYLWEKEKLAGIFLLATGFLSQILMLLFIRYLMMVF